MNTGDVVKVKDLKVAIQDGKGYVQYKATKPMAFKLLVLGVDRVEDAEEKWKPEESLNALGWHLEPTVDQLAQEIRRVDGENKLGAGELAEALLAYIKSPRPHEA